MKHRIDVHEVEAGCLQLLERSIWSEPFRIGRHRLQFEFTGLQLTAHWTPDPKPGTRGIIRPYRRARNDFLRLVARETGLNMAVVDV